MATSSSRPTRRPGLYVHVPFCARACPYCDFDFEVGAMHQVPAYLDAISDLAQHYAAQGWSGFDTVYLGGGTPSMLDPSSLAQLFESLGPLAKLADMREVTVEFNPEHAHPDCLAAIRELGVHRVSMGVQSFETEGLVSLGRAHRARAAKAAIEAAKALGLSVSCDLMVGWPGQTRAGLARDLDLLTELDLAHLSIYALTIEAGSRWPELVRRGLRELPDQDEQGERLWQVHQALLAAGYVHYEVASYAKEGQIARHNAKYWSWQDYLGLGPSAHSAKYGSQGQVQRWGSHRGLANWLAAPHQVQDAETLEGDQSAAEALWLGLRRLDGLSLLEFERCFPQIDRAWILKKTERLQERGLLQLEHERLLVSPEQWMMHDEIAHDLLA